MKYPCITRNNRGFTIIETLVAITVLMIAVVGPLSVASRGLTSALFSKDQMIATYLAQESMEAVKNLRDNNISSSAGWLSSMIGNLDTTCTSDHRCDANALEGFASCSATYCPLYFGSSGYSHVSTTGTVTQFSRSFYVLQITPTEYRVYVIVTWKEGTIPNEVDLTSELVNTVR